MLAQVEINKLESQKLNEIEEMRLRMVQITSEAALTVLGLKNDLARLDRSYVSSRATCLKWEKILSACKDTTSLYNLDKERMFDGIQILYRMLCKRRGMSLKSFDSSWCTNSTPADIVPSYHSYEIDKIMSFIMREISLLSSVLQELESNKGDKVGAGRMC